MKRLLCAILTLVCILALCSCNMLDKFISTEPDAKPTATTPEVSKTTTPDNTTEESIPNETTPEEVPEATTPEEAPEETTPEEAPEETTPDQTPPEESFQPMPENYFPVQVVFQSGGVHRVEETFMVKESCTFNNLYTAFVQKHSLESFSIIPYLNGELIDTSKTVYLQEGDSIYLEEYSGMPGEEPVCPHAWISGSCERCGAVCEHNEWDDNGQCLICGFWMGVNLIEIEIYENGEYKFYTQINEITLWDLIMAYYGYPWDYMVDSYEFYYNDMLVTEGSYLITESGRLDLVTRTYE